MTCKKCSITKEHLISANCELEKINFELQYYKKLAQSRRKDARFYLAALKRIRSELLQPDVYILHINQIADNAIKHEGREDDISGD